MRKPIPTALTIAGSDSGGGAGIQADLKTFAVMGVHGMSAITSITAQNTYEVRAIYDIPPEIVAAQIEAVAEDLGVDAAKTGMLSNTEIIKVVAATVDRYGFPLVVDPVMIAKSKAKLLRDDAVEALVKLMIPRATVVTPNAPEAERITGLRVESLRDAREAARVIVEEYGAEAAVVKGGHLTGEYSVDVLYYKGEFYEYKSRRVDSKTTHGTGCSFAAAIAAGLAKGRSVPEAVEAAKELVTTAIEYGLDIGRGHGPVNPVAYMAIPAERWRVLENVESAVRILVENGRVVSRVIPEVLMNIGMALPYPYARSPLDVAAVPGRIGRYKDAIIVKAKPEFGVSSHIARAILAAMSHDPTIRAAANIAYSREIEDTVASLGYTHGSFDRRIEPPEVKAVEGATTKWGIDSAVARLGRVPDVIYDYGEHGKEPLTLVFGRSAVEVAEKVVSIARTLKQ